MSEEEARQVLVDAAKAAGIPPHLIYALRKTGLIMDEEKRYRFSEEQRREVAYLRSSVDEWMEREAALTLDRERRRQPRRWGG